MSIDFTDGVIIALIILVMYGGFLIPDLIALFAKQSVGTSTTNFRLVIRGVAAIIGAIQAYLYKLPTWVILLNLVLVGISSLITILIQNHLNQRYPVSSSQQRQYGASKMRFGMLFFFGAIFGVLHLLRYQGLSPFWVIPFSAALSCISYGLFSKDGEPFHRHCLAFVSAASIFALWSYSQSQ